MSDRLRTTLLPLIAAFIWGIAFVAQKGNTVGTLTFSASRAVVAFLFLCVVILVMSKGDVKHLLAGKTSDETRVLWRGGLCCGASLACASFLQQMGLDADTEAGKAGFLTALYIVLVPLLGLILKKRAPGNVWGAVAIAVGGLYLLCVKEGFVVRPSDMVVLAGSLMFALQILFVDHFSPQCDGVKLSCVQFLVCSVVSAVPALIFEEVSIAAFSESVLPILYLGVFSSGVAFTLQIVAQKNSNPTVVSLLLSMESVFSVLAGALILGEVLNEREYLGCALMAAAVILAQLPERKRVQEGSGESPESPQKNKQSGAA